MISETWSILSRRRKFQVVILLMMMVAGSVFEMAGIGAIVPFLAALIDPDLLNRSEFWKRISEIANINEKSEIQYFFSAVFVLAVTMASCFRLIVIFVQTKLTAAFAYEFSSSTYKKLLEQDYNFHISKNTGELISLINKSGDLSGILILPILNFINSSVIACGIFIALLYIDATVALISLFGFGSLYALIFYISRIKVRKYSEIMSQSSIDTVKSLQEGFGGIRNVILDKLYKYYSDIYSDACYAQKMAGAKIALISSAPRFLVEVVGVVFIALIALVMVRTEGGIDTAIPTLGALALGAQRLLPLLQQAFASITTLRGYIVSSNEALEALKLESRQSVGAPVLFGSFSNSVVFRDVALKYPNEQRYVLDNINFELKKGSRLGIIGVTGCGKSSLLDIFMGLLPPTKGEVLVDKEILTSDSMPKWQAQIAHVPQAIYLSDSSIAANIAFGSRESEIDLERVVACARLANLSSTIELLPQGYHTSVGERGVRLSGGQRQRVGIARALYKGANVIVFDEATSALDTKTEREVIEAIESVSKNVTIVMVAHRITTLSVCDQIIELGEGRIKWTGTYANLLDEKRNLP